jgi:hypothetical protein
MSPRRRYRSTPSDHPYGRGPRRSLDTLQLPDPQSDGLSRGPPDARSSPVPVHALLTALSPPTSRTTFLDEEVDVSAREHAAALVGSGPPRRPDDFRRTVGFATAEEGGARHRGALDAEAYAASVREVRLFASDLRPGSTYGALADALASNAQLRSLTLSAEGHGGGVSAHATAVLCAALETHPSIATLDLHGLPVHPRCVEHLLARNTSLRTLDLYGSWCPSCADDPASALADGGWVRVRQPLHEHGELVASPHELLPLQRCAAGAGAAEWRVRGVRVVPAQLQPACYDGGGGGGRALVAIAAGLRANVGLEELSLALRPTSYGGGHGAGASQRHYRALEDAVLAHPTLRSFNAIPLRRGGGGGGGGGGGAAAAADGGCFALSFPPEVLLGGCEVRVLARRWLEPRAAAEAEAEGSAERCPPLPLPPRGLGGLGGALVELSLSGAAGGLGPPDTQLLFQALVRQGGRADGQPPLPGGEGECVPRVGLGRRA